jgi:hypothetical protein
MAVWLLYLGKGEEGGGGLDVIAIEILSSLEEKQ